MMKPTGLARAAVYAAVLLMGGLTVAPAIAAPADVEFLEQFVGSWKGRGQLSGANTETVVCKLTLTSANDDKVNYAGRCTMAGTTLSINGTIGYVAANRRFEAAMTTNVGFSGTAGGRKQGNSIVFDINDTQKDPDGNDLKINAKMILADNKIAVDFKVTYVTTGDTVIASVPFTK